MGLRTIFSFSNLGGCKRLRYLYIGRTIRLCGRRLAARSGDEKKARMMLFVCLAR